jgi:hypothetical protein
MDCERFYRCSEGKIAVEGGRERPVSVKGVEMVSINMGEIHYEGVLML